MSKRRRKSVNIPQVLHVVTMAFPEYCFLTACIDKRCTRPCTSKRLKRRLLRKTCIHVSESNSHQTERDVTEPAGSVHCSWCLSSFVSRRRDLIDSKGLRPLSWRLFRRHGKANLLIATLYLGPCCHPRSHLICVRVLAFSQPLRLDVKVRIL